MYACAMYDYVYMYALDKYSTFATLATYSRFVANLLPTNTLVWVCRMETLQFWDFPFQYPYDLNFTNWSGALSYAI